ncbi:GFA family protein [Paeniroseomonas aquatica]|uniref:GFA family protein n=1 Tax=Paeniroseomonas aquatica TaxID=373043 RepID=A0ABT8A8G9_9PROT|nr:GFA family protein [Paeniroseomonas aquatica]MDN3566010.1 GFA family protein [Paeniroseomonas aquatica]
MKLPQTGGCLCGAVRYEITGPPLVTYTCHCTVCQRLTGSAFSSAVVVAAEAYRFAGGETLSFERLADSGRTVTRWVCAGCGTWICNGVRPGTAPPGGFVAVRAGTLDDTSWLRPTAHFWTRSVQPWVVLPEGDTCFETQPEDGLAWLRSIGNHQRRSDH